MKYEGFVGLTLSEASAKNMEYRHALKDHWKALKVQRQDAKGEGGSLVKKKWDDGLYFMAQDVCIQDTLRPNRAVHRLAIMGFVRTTCVRAGSMARDWFD